MTTLHIDPPLSCGALRERIYAGDLALFTSLDAIARLVEYAQAALTQLFPHEDPREAHLRHGPEEMAAMLGSWKPRFIHDARSTELVVQVLVEAGFSAPDTHLDVPKPRTSFPVDHLTTGIAYAFPWHRDCWYGAPPQQINWWLPIYDVRADNALQFDTSSFAVPVPNDSARLDYYQANVDRLTTAQQVRREEQVRPRAIDHHVDDPLVVLMKPGSVLVFGGAHLHATVPNSSPYSRYSIDFRTVDANDVVAGRGAPFVDVACTGTALRDFRNASTGDRFPEDLVQRLYGPPPTGAMLVYGPPPRTSRL